MPLYFIWSVFTEVFLSLSQGCKTKKQKIKVFLPPGFTKRIETCRAINLDQK